MKKILLLTSVPLKGEKPHYLSEEAFGNKLRAQLDETKYSLTMAALPDLIYQTGTKTSIWHPVEGYDLADFDAIIVRKVGHSLELGIAVAHYAHAKNITFTDEYLLTNGNGKLACAFIRALHGLPVPDTLYGPSKYILERQLTTFPVIVKADIGHAGQDNYLVQNEDEYKQLLENQKQMMVTQPYIENDGDYRILVINHKPKLAILRQKATGSHLNNTSQGGSAKIVEVTTLSERLREDAMRASRLEKVEVAGVDMIVDKQTGLHKILEVNRAPQIPSGSFIDEKITVYADFIKETVDKRTSKRRQLNTIGRVEDIAFPEILDDSVKARIDTGAKTSSIWGVAETTDDGRLAVKFLGEEHDSFQPKIHYFDDFQRTVVASSIGVKQRRYKVKLLTMLGNRRIRAWFTIADRSAQAYPVLVGRNVLMNKFVVDVFRGEPDFAAQSRRSNELNIEDEEK